MKELTEGFFADLIAKRKAGHFTGDDIQWAIDHGQIITDLRTGKLMVISAVNPPSDELVKHAIRNAVLSLFIKPVLDGQAPEKFSEAVKIYRELANKWGAPSTAPVVYRIRPGFTLKRYAPVVGPCKGDFKFLQNWNFNDKPTADALVFWVPRLVPGSNGKNMGQQKEILAKLRKNSGLSKEHFSCFGSAALNSLLIFGHYQATGEQVPLDGRWIRTDVRLSDGGRLGLCWGGGGLSCGRWDWDGDALDFLGCFALGVVLGHLGS